MPTNISNIYDRLSLTGTKTPNQQRDARSGGVHGHSIHSDDRSVFLRRGPTGLIGDVCLRVSYGAATQAAEQ